MQFPKILALLALLFATSANGEDESAALSQVFAERNPKTLAVLSSDFPQDYKSLMIRVGTLERSGQSEMLMLSGAFDALRTIRRRYADRLLFAPPQALSKLLASAALFHDAVLQGEGPGGCGVFAQNGTGALFQLHRSEVYAKQIDDQSAAYFEAVAGAIERPEYYGEPSQKDFAALLAALAAAGVSKDYITSIASGKPSDPDLCPALSTMFKAAAVLDTPEGLRARADLAKNLSGY